MWTKTGIVSNKGFGVAYYLYVVTCLDLSKQLLSTCLSVQFHVMGLWLHLIEMVLFGMPSLHIFILILSVRCEIVHKDINVKVNIHALP